jgi:serine/threonine protein kinase
MLSGVQPFKGDNIKELQKNILSGKFNKLDFTSYEVNNLIEGMLQVDPKKRLNVIQVLNHPWLSNVNVKNRFNMNLFTNAEKLLLNKFNVDYLNNTKDDLVEIFSDKNLDTLEDDKKEIGNTKSLILAPYNSFACSSDNINNKFILIENNICKFKGKAFHANLKYELNNNNEFDNGVIKTQKSIDLINYDYDSNNFSSGNNSYSKQISPNIELNDDYNYEKKSNLNSPKNKSNYKQKNILNIKENVVKDIENLIGYDSKYLVNCLLKNEINYATATYYLLENEYLD